MTEGGDSVARFCLVFDDDAPAPSCHSVEELATETKKTCHTARLRVGVPAVGQAVLVEDQP